MRGTFKKEVWAPDGNFNPSAQRFEYSIVLDGEEVYCGYGYGDNQNVEDIFMDYLECEGLAHIQDSEYLEWEGSAYRCFEIYIDGELDSRQCVLRGYDREWSQDLYGNHSQYWSGTSQCLSEPINGYIDPRMQILHTDFKATTGESINYIIIPRVTILTPLIETTAAGQTAHFTVDSNCDYSASTDGNWLVVSPVQSSAGTRTFDVYLEGNSGRIREGSIIISYENEYGEVVSQTIPVIQHQTNITVSPDTQTLPAYPEESYGTLTVTADGPYFIGIDEPWLNISAYSGDSGTSIYTIIQDMNEQPSSRTAIITVGLDDYVVVEQEAASIVVNPSTITAAPAGGVYTFEVTSNIPYTASTEADWFTLSSTTGETGTTEFEITLGSYTGTTDRTATITIGYQTLTFVQLAAAIDVSPTALTFDYKGQSKTFTVTATTDYTISTAAEWLTLSAVSGSSGVSTYTVTAASNYGGDGRTATVTIGDKTISITQAKDANVDSYFRFKSKNKNVAVSNLSTSGCDSRAELYWSTDLERWTRIYSGNTVSFIYDGWVYLKGKKSNQTGCSQPPYVAIGTTAGNNTLTIAGNILSLVYGDDFLNVTSETDGFQEPRLRNDSGITDAYDLVLPQVLGSNNFYDFQFQNFTGLKKAPVLSTKVLKANEYKGLFSGCTSLNYIKCLATDISASSCTENWVAGVAPVGLFVKAAGVDWPVGNSGIPNGWVAIDEGGIDAITSSNVFPTTGGTITITAGCESNYAISTDADWVTLSASSGAPGATVFTATAQAFQGSARYATIYVGSKQIVLGQNVDAYYLTFDIVSGGTINWAPNVSYYSQTIYYSKDNGVNWNAITTGEAFNVNANDRIIFKGTNNRYYTVFSGSTASFNLSGNILSLIYGDDFVGKTGVTENSTFDSLFRHTNVIDASSLILPSGVTQYCCWNMFRDCTSLTKAPNILPAAHLANYCYYSMFDGCTSLTSAPALPAIILAPNCYGNMFQGCTSLTTAPELPAATLVQDCYRFMFDGCTALNYIKCLATNIPSTNCVKYWVRDVAATGTFVKAEGMTGWTRGINGIPEGWTVPEVDSDYFAFDIISGGTINWKRSNDSADALAIEYSLDSGATWTSITATTEGVSINVSAGDSVWFRGNTNGTGYSADTGNYCTFSGSTAYFNAKGYLMSIAKSSGFKSYNISAPRTFKSLFYTTNIVDASGLIMPSTIVSQFEFRGTFRECHSLTTAPNLPAATLTNYAYYEMFLGSTNLNYVKCLATSKQTNSTTRWLAGVSATGTFVKKSGSSWISSASGIPSGWTVQEE